MSYLDGLVDAYRGKYVYEFDNQIQMNWYPGRIIGSTSKESSVLELGLGHGISTNTFSRYYKSYKVIDASQAVIANFKEKFPDSNALIENCYFEDYVTDSKYDVIIMGFILEHVDDPDLILDYYKKYLKEDGRIFISVPNAEVMNRRLGVYAETLKDVCLLSDHDYACGHKRYYTVKSLSDQVMSNGYKIIKTEGIYLKPLSTNQMISLKLEEKYINALCMLGVEYPELSCGILMEAKF
jgi:2-polyprenyl-3-methyl-5-hydroxy-6-metoxy-1,4-benzoquinol methylase